jgi:histone acetyltransferase HTATIP
MTELLVPGCKTWVQKEIDGESTYKEAEIISVREGKIKDLEFYVHYIDFNKRLDEWIKIDVIDLTRIEPPKPSKKKATQTDSHSKQQGKDLIPKQLFGIHKKRAQQPKAVPASNGEIEESALEKKNEQSTLSNAEIMEEYQNFANEYHKMSLAPLQTCSKQQEIENLRRGGSMTQRAEEISRVRNIAQIEMGKHRVNTWYFSPYPESICNDQGLLYICEF